MRYRALIVAFLALCLGALTACSEGPVNAADRGQLTYDDVVGTGLANKCPQLSENRRGSIAIDSETSYALVDMCVQPTEFYVKEEPANKRQEAQFVSAKLLTRSTSSLDQVSGPLQLDENGTLTFYERDGIDFQPITVQLPGGEQVPFLFTIKNLVAETPAPVDAITTSTDLSGAFDVPSYRTAGFLDTKGRGLASGYDNAIALPARADSEELTRENVKQVDVRRGELDLQVAKVDSQTGEIAGTFESVQPSDTDMGAKPSSEVKVRGVFYARLEKLGG